MTEETRKPEIPADLADAPCFIERQFPVAKLSMESYAERRANQGQSITSLGKWWGRKPLVLVRAALLGLLLPATDNANEDLDVFLKLMTMDKDGLWQRKNKNIPENRLVEELFKSPPSIQHQYLQKLDAPETITLRKLSIEEKYQLQHYVFDRMPYDEKLDYCVRPEQSDGPSDQLWNEINTHLKTSAANFHDLIQELGNRRFGKIPCIGDAFCGGGSIPFEAARIGCDVYGSDLNPVAALLTWAALNVVGGNEIVTNLVTETQRKVYEIADSQINEWGIEQNSMGWRADAYLYCSEVIDPESGWKIPVAPSWVIAPTTKTIAKLIPDFKNKRYDIVIIENASQEEFDQAVNLSTTRDSRLIPPNGGTSTPFDAIRNNLGMWGKKDIIPSPDDVFQERLYCIRWIETYKDKIGKLKKRRHYRAPTTEDINRENQVLEYVQQFFDDWQEKGYIPSRQIEPGDETARLQRERGWTYWHHLFTPRQLLIIGMLQAITESISMSKVESVINLLAVGRYADWNSKLCRWGTGASRESIGQTFTNQALNTLYSFANKAFSLARGTWFINPIPQNFNTNIFVLPLDCRQISKKCDIWITDPPYADAVNYHELTEFFLAWYERRLKQIFPEWYTDSKRNLAVQGSDANFRQSMLACYTRLKNMMPENGLQIVMFTHQDSSVWADLSMILWASGLKVTAAWCIQTEREAAGVRSGNYVQGTVLLVLRKRTETVPIFMDEVIHQVELEVRRQLDSMIQLEDESDPNFGDADYQLAAYAAALRVLTERPIEEINPEREILRQRRPGEVSQVEQLIRNAVKIACDHLVPRHLDAELWKRLEPMERFYIKGLEVESHGEYRSGVYQELARGFGANEYTELLANTKANETRLKTAGEFGRKGLSGAGFGSSLVRQCLFAAHLTAKSEETREGLNWLHTELPDYWSSRERIALILEYLGRLRFVTAMEHWQADAEAAQLLAGAVRNDHV